MIYDLALRSQTVYLDTRSPSAIRSQAIKDACRPHPLTFVSRKIRSEVISLPSSVEFVIKNRWILDRCLDDGITLVHTIGSKLEEIEHLGRLMFRVHFSLSMIILPGWWTTLVVDAESGICKINTKRKEPRERCGKEQWDCDGSCSPLTSIEDRPGDPVYRQTIKEHVSSKLEKCVQDDHTLRRYSFPTEGIEFLN